MTTTDAPRRGGFRARLARTSVRARILTVVVGLSALGLVASGLTAHALQVRVVDARLDAELRASVTEFSQLATNGVDPSTGDPFATPRALVRATMQLKVPSRNEGMLGIVDGRVSLTASVGTPLRLEEDAELVAALTASSPPAATLGTLTTSTSTYRYVVIPVTLEGSADSGAIVRAYDREAELAALRRTYRTFAVVALASLGVVGLVGWALAGRLLRPVRELDAAARGTGVDGDLTRRIPVTSADDLGRLTGTVNAMLDRLDAAFSSQRQLLDDVGHELRTPVTIVRGHLELMDPDDPADVRAVREVALAELDRSSRLLDDLMVLATSDRPDFVRRAPTDVGRLTDDLHDTVRGLADRTWRVDARADVVVTLDPQRVTQAVAQLAANAVRHTAVGDEIAVGSRHVPPSPGSPAHVEIWVRDTGPGIPADERERVVERFERGADGDREHDGAGLGLSIVAAIAHAHGGSLLVDDAPGGGALLTLRLPADDLHVPETTGTPGS